MSSYSYTKLRFMQRFWISSVFICKVIYTFHILYTNATIDRYNIYYYANLILRSQYSNIGRRCISVVLDKCINASQVSVLSNSTSSSVSPSILIFFFYRVLSLDHILILIQCLVYFNFCMNQHPKRKNAIYLPFRKERVSAFPRTCMQRLFKNCVIDSLNECQLNMKKLRTLRYALSSYIISTA